METSAIAYSVQINFAGPARARGRDFHHIELEAIPKSLKKGVLSPVFKGHGKDPFLVDSYRGITVTSVPGLQRFWSPSFLTGWA